MESKSVFSSLARALLACGLWLAAALPTTLSAAPETEAETIARCLKDLQSQDVAARRRAAMLIGKYRTPAAEAAVLRCLHDPDTQIRQSALVSLTEDKSLPPNARMEVLRLLKDPDVHIRRIASSLLPEVAAAASLNSDIYPQIVKAYNDGLDDDDASVRRNVLLAARYMPYPLDREKLERFFTDASEENRLMALTLYARLSGFEKNSGAQMLRKLLDDRSPMVRMALARLAGDLDDKDDDILQTLLKDPELKVRIEALRQYAAHDGDKAFEMLKVVVLDENIPSDLRLKLLPILTRYQEQAMPVYKLLLKGDNAAIGGEVMALLAYKYPDKLPISFFINYLDSDKEEIRKGAQRALSIHATDLSPKDIKKLAECKNTEGRLMGLRMCGRLDLETRVRLLQDACLDDNQEIRLYALRQIGLQHIPDWEDMLLASLEDPEPQIQAVAVEGLCRRPTPQIRQALQEYLQNCQDERLKLLIKRTLSRPALP